MLKYEVTKKETIPLQEALAACQWHGNHKDSGPQVESTETIMSGPYPNISIAQVAELHEKHVSMITDDSANLHALNALYVMCHLRTEEINSKKVLCSMQYRLDPGKGNAVPW